MSLKRFLSFVLLSLVASVVSAAESASVAAARHLLEAQRDAWMAPTSTA